MGHSLHNFPSLPILRTKFTILTVVLGETEFFYLHSPTFFLFLFLCVHLYYFYIFSVDGYFDVVGRSASSLSIVSDEVDVLFLLGICAVLIIAHMLK